MDLGNRVVKTWRVERGGSRRMGVKGGKRGRYL